MDQKSVGDREETAGNAPVAADIANVSREVKPLTAEQLQILQHSLGADKYGRIPNPAEHGSRNHFCAGGSDESICRELVALGYMRTWRNTDADGRTEGFPYFNCSVTDEGLKAMREESPKPPKLSRSQKRYRAFLRHDSGLSFIEWLQSYGREASC